MANKPYVTVKRINEVLSLYGVVILKEYNWGRNSISPIGYHWYITALEHEHTHSWDVPRYYLPDFKTNQQLLEFALANLDKVA